MLSARPVLARLARALPEVTFIAVARTTPVVQHST